MQRQLTILFAAALLTIAAAAQDTTAGSAPAAPAASAPAGPATTTPDNPNFKTEQEKNGYALGMELGAGFKRQGMEVDPETFARGFADAFAGGKTLLSDDEAKVILKAAQQKYEEKQAAIRAAKAEEAKKAGDDFLAANKAKDGVVTLPDGLQYKIVKAGEGKKPAASDTVVCNYRGTFIDGTEFDSSEKNGGPATFQVGGVIKGWTEALQLMPVGSKWQLFLPSALAYGETGAGNVIPPDATLVFDVELVSIKDKEEPAPDAPDKAAPTKESTPQ
jgi:FKBP-type peptidyl-prolyl cis-trans isomerase FklB